MHHEYKIFVCSSQVELGSFLRKIVIAKTSKFINYLTCYKFGKGVCVSSNKNMIENWNKPVTNVILTNVTASARQKSNKAHTVLDQRVVTYMFMSLDKILLKFQYKWVLLITIPDVVQRKFIYPSLCLELNTFIQ